jgi:hypothetical protein
MKIQPTNNQSFNGKNTVIQYVKPTSYGKCIHGKSTRGFDYDVYVCTDKRTGNIMHKLYYITKNNKFIKSALRFFSNNKAYKEVKSENWL